MKRGRFDEAFNRPGHNSWPVKFRRIGRGAFYIGRHVVNAVAEVGYNVARRHGKAIMKQAVISGYAGKLQKLSGREEYEASHSQKKKVYGMAPHTPRKSPRQHFTVTPVKRIGSKAHSWKGSLRKGLESKKDSEGFGRSSEAAVQLVTGVEEYTEVYGHRKLTKKQKLLKALSAPVLSYSLFSGVGAGYGSNGNQASIVTIPGFSQSSLLTIVDRAVTQTNAGIPGAAVQDTQVLIKSLTNKFTITNKGAGSMKITYYNHVCKEDTASSPQTLSILEANNEGAACAANSLFLNFDVKRYKSVKYLWKLVHEKVFYLAAYETIQITSTLKPNIMVNYTDLQALATGIFVKALSQTFTFLHHGVTLADLTVGGTPEINPTSWNFVNEETSVVLPYPLPSVAVRQFLGTLPTPVGAPSAVTVPHPKTETSVTGNSAMP